MPPPPTSSIPCLRCASFELQCCVIDPSSPSHSPKFICNQCDVAGLDQCIFPPSIRLAINTRSNTKCMSCSQIKSKCVFLNESDEQCARCRKLHIPCVFKLNGKCQRYLFIIVTNNIHANPPLFINYNKHQATGMTFLARGSIMFQVQCAIRLYSQLQCCHASTFSIRQMSLLRRGSMFSVLSKAHLFERRRPPSHICSHIMWIWWLSGSACDFSLHIIDLSSLAPSSKISQFLLCSFPKPAHALICVLG